MAASIETSGNTLKMSYLRFISDAAPGLVVILTAVVLQDRGVFQAFQSGMGKEFKALLAVVALLLSVPIGLAVNGLSHLVLGSLQTLVNQICFSVRFWPIGDTHRSSLTDEWSRCFSVGKVQWPLFAETVDELLLIYAPEAAEALDHVRALKKFLRSVAFLALVGLVVRVAVEFSSAGVRRVPDFVAWALLAATVLAIALGGYITFYQQASGMMRAYILCGMPQDPTTITILELRQLLIARAAESCGGAEKSLRIDLAMRTAEESGAK